MRYVSRLVNGCEVHKPSSEWLIMRDISGLIPGHHEVCKPSSEWLIMRDVGGLIPGHHEVRESSSEWL